jgi:hypothetical protein
MKTSRWIFKFLAQHSSHVFNWTSLSNHNLTVCQSFEQFYPYKWGRILEQAFLIGLSRASSILARADLSRFEPSLQLSEPARAYPKARLEPARGQHYISLARPPLQMPITYWKCCWLDPIRGRGSCKSVIHLMLAVCLYIARNIVDAVVDTLSAVTSYLGGDGEG